MKAIQFSFILIALLVNAMSVSLSAHERPNIVFILLDNVGKEWFGCYGSQENATPNIDRLASSGLRFENCYATPYCSTSRAMLLTGRYPHTTGWRFHHDAGIYGGGNFDWNREITFARLLRDAGYATCIAGKWQINNFNEAGQEQCLSKHGFDEHLVTPGGKNDSKYWDPLLIQNGERSVRTGEFGPDLYTEFVQDFIQRHRDHEFLVYFPITLVHTPLPTTPRTKGKELTSIETFRENLRYADELIGKVVVTLDKLKLRERTFIFVSADNGGPPSFPAQTDQGIVRGFMGTFVEPSINMPLIINGPIQFSSSRIATMTDYTDILPTIADLARLSLPNDLKVDGQSFAPALFGKNETRKRDWIHTALNDERIVRDQRFKLYSSGEFYDLQKDPAEERNLANSTDVEIVTARQRLETALKSIPADNPLDFEPNSVASRRYREQKAAGQSTLLKRNR